MREDHSENCPWWWDWHACDCGVFDLEPRRDNMARGRNYTPAERALQLICAKAGASYKEFYALMEQSQGKEPRTSPESSYKMVRENYLSDLETNAVDWTEMLNHIRSPRDKFGR